MNPTCSTCALWQRRIRPHRHEAAAYLAHRPCNSDARPGFHGSQTHDPVGRLITAPTAGCARHLERGGER